MNIEEIKKSMQRERKWRIVTPSGKMIYDPGFELGLAAYPGASVRASSLFDVDNGFHWMDYTGLKDSNGQDGQEFYEGDVCELDNGVGFVITFSSGCYWANYGDMGKEFLFKVLKEHSCKVIGNIFENPELLQ